MIHDLIVIGAGPAGCSTAILAAQNGARVLLIERGHFPRNKVCGEFVSAESLGLLAQLLAPEHRKLIADAPQISRARIFADNAEVHAEITPHAAGITRFDLDQALWDSCRVNAVELRDDCAVLEAQRTFSADTEGIFEVTTTAGICAAKALVNAAGRWSFLTAPEIRKRATGERWIGVKAHFREISPPTSVDLYFFEGGYCGVQPVSSMRRNGTAAINACAMVKASVATDISQVFRRHSALQSRSAGWEALTEPVSTSPLVFHEPEPVRDGMLQVGDAATFVDPFVGDGISMAIRSGAIAAQCLASFFRKEQSLAQAAENYSRQYRRKLAGVFRASSRLRSLLQWPALIRKPAMSLLQRSPAIATRLVKMTR